MILETDFLDHWKTRLLIDTLQDELASNYVLRLWFHCQNRKTIHFPGMTPQMLKAICRFPGDGKTLLGALLQCGFVEVEQDTISVPKYAEINSKMTANWANGQATADAFRKRKIEAGKANDRPTGGQTKATGGADSKDSKDSKEEEEGDDGGAETSSPSNNSPKGLIPDYETIFEGIPEPVKKASIQAAQHYCSRRYRGMQFHKSWYPDLLREVASIFEVQSDPMQAVETFRKACVAKPTPALDRNASFSDICLSCGLKQAKPPPWEVSKATQQHDGMKQLNETIDKLFKASA